MRDGRTPGSGRGKEKKMKVKFMFQCEGCGSLHETSMKAMECEASHYGLTYDQYEDWRALSRMAGDAGRRISLTKDDEAEDAFDNACRRLADFEAAHGIPADARKPSDFLY